MFTSQPPQTGTLFNGYTTNVPSSFGGPINQYNNNGQRPMMGSGMNSMMSQQPRMIQSDMMLSSQYSLPQQNMRYGQNNNTFIAPPQQQSNMATGMVPQQYGMNSMIPQQSNVGNMIPQQYGMSNINPQQSNVGVIPQQQSYVSSQPQEFMPSMAQQQGLNVQDQQQKFISTTNNQVDVNMIQQLSSKINDISETLIEIANKVVKIEDDYKDMKGFLNENNRRSMQQQQQPQQQQCSPQQQQQSYGGGNYLSPDQNSYPVKHLNNITASLSSLHKQSNQNPDTFNRYTI
ncbi:MAG: hypothetical protein KDH96_09735 [Candidatus Riesia sp.]|nr:hypothetical protein [Candidatus Riesia sp.]